MTGEVNDPHHDPRRCTECRHGKREVQQEWIRWIASRGVLAVMVIIALGFILVGELFGGNGSISSATGDNLVYIGIGLIVFAVGFAVLMFAAKD